MHLPAFDRKRGGPLAVVAAPGHHPVRLPLRRDSIPGPPTLRQRQRMEHADWMELRLPDRRQLPSPWRRLVAWACCAREAVRSQDEARERYRLAHASCLAHRAAWQQDLQVQWEARYGEGPPGLRVCSLAGGEAVQRQALALLSTPSRQLQRWPNERLRSAIDALAQASAHHDRVVRTDLKAVRAAPHRTLDPEQAHRVAQALLDQVLTHPEVIAQALPSQREDVKGQPAIRSTWHDLIARQLRISLDILQDRQHPARLKAQDLVDAINDLMTAYGLPRRAAAIVRLGADDAGAVVLWR